MAVSSHSHAIQDNLRSRTRSTVPFSKQECENLLVAISRINCESKMHRFIHVRISVVHSFSGYSRRTVCGSSFTGVFSVDWCSRYFVNFFSQAAHLKARPFRNSIDVLIIEITYTIMVGMPPFLSDL